LSSDYVAANRARWTRSNAEYTNENAARAWAQDEITWGIWHLPEAELGVLPDLAGLDVVELGCGTAYFSAWLARRDARVVAVDVTPEQLATARGLQQELGISFPLIEANAENVPLADASFDVAFSEYGASIWCDPDRWVPEAARLLRPGGLLAFLVNGTFLVLCWPDDGYAGTELLRSYFDLGEHGVAGEEINFHIGYGEWIRVLRSSGFDVERLIEIQAPPDAVEHPLMEVTPEWGRRWPADEIWVARKR
jgi:SAM-dependent methyltransferase